MNDQPKEKQTKQVNQNELNQAVFIIVFDIVYQAVSEAVQGTSSFQVCE